MKLAFLLHAQAVASTVDAYASGVERALGGALDPRRLAPAAGGARGAAAVAGTSGAKLGDIVWQRLSKVRAVPERAGSDAHEGDGGLCACLWCAVLTTYSFYVLNLCDIVVVYRRSTLLILPLQHC